ncbi:flagellin, partial [Pseudomonadales bacterium]|nr:flagellin [Pseudomonadales bacterium]
FSAVYTAVGDGASNVTITEKAGNITNAAIAVSSVALAATDFAATEANTTTSVPAVQGSVTDAGFTNAEIADLTAVVAGAISVTVSGLTDIDSLTDALNADNAFTAAYVASSVGSGLVITEAVGSETAADITLTYTDGGNSTHTPSLTQANGTVEVLGIDTLVTTDAEIAAAQTMTVGGVAVDVSAATNESTLVTELNGDSNFAARYVASSTGANNLTITEVAGQAQGSNTAVTRTSNTITTGISASASAIAGVEGTVTRDITDAEITALESITIGSISVATAGVTSATNMAELTTALNADSTFAASYVATSVNNTLTVTEQAAAMTTDAIATSGVVISADEAFTSAVTAGTTGVVATDAFTSEVATAAVAGSVTQAMTDTEIDELSSLTVGGIAVNSAALLAATDMTTLVAALNAEPTTAGSFGEKYTASDVGGDLVITEKAGQFTSTSITVVGAGTAAADFAAAESAVVGSVSTTTVGSTGTLGFGADISGLTSTTADVIDILDAALKSVSTQRAEHGAAINRLEYTADNLSNVSLNTQASRSRIEDADYAKATTELARTQIIQQAGTAMLAQANQQSQGVLALLQ